jgi:hypothetical protein
MQVGQPPVKPAFWGYIPPYSNVREPSEGDIGLPFQTLDICTKEVGRRGWVEMGQVSWRGYPESRFDKGKPDGNWDWGVSMQREKGEEPLHRSGQCQSGSHEPISNSSPFRSRVNLSRNCLIEVFYGVKYCRFVEK